MLHYVSFSIILYIDIAEVTFDTSILFHGFLSESFMIYLIFEFSDTDILISKV